MLFSNTYLTKSVLKVSLGSTDELPTVGESYSLTCSAGVMGSANTPKFQWYQDGNALSTEDSRSITDEEKTSSPYCSTLRFSPLQEFHQGTYTCTVTVDGVSSNSTANVSVGGEKVLSAIIVNKYLFC